MRAPTPGSQRLRELIDARPVDGPRASPAPDLRLAALGALACLVVLVAVLLV